MSEQGSFHGPSEQAPPEITSDSSPPVASANWFDGVTRRDLVIIIFRLLGAYVLYLGVFAILRVGMVAWDLHGFSWSILASEVLALLFYACVGSVLWFGASRIGKWVLPKSRGTETGAVPAIAVKDLQSAAFAFLGVMIISLWAVPSMLVDAFTLISGPDVSGFSQVSIETKTLLVRDIAQFVIGAWLFYGSKRLAGVWDRTHAGASAVADENSPL